ncbi:hypothetical protein C7S16_5796 [Burkholderia thailandensis]|uniref:Uncharacterized protein n=1 Tax=Burkholderia thailandensis TaxID=57975 RepID=A0AAW9CNJ8_BURTH|nr:hypothetical protein [Burkholderia thailandensis]MDW9250668.1 hypothetical protein [Burkholderia thailandensis]
MKPGKYAVITGFALNFLSDSSISTICWSHPSIKQWWESS